MFLVFFIQGLTMAQSPPPVPPAPPFPPVQAAGYCSNLAQGKTASQISTYAGNTSPYYPAGPAYLSVDGNANPDYNSGASCSHTGGSELSPWWYVDLGSAQIVAQVFIKNRGVVAGIGGELSH